MGAPSDLSDEQLVAQVQAGDKEQFGLLVGRYQARLQRYGRKFLREPELIEDAVQEVFLKAYRHLQSFNPSLKFSSWIYRIAHNVFVSTLGREARQPFRFFDFDTLLARGAGSEPETAPEHRREMKEMAEQGLEQLNPKYREVLILYYLEELSYQEISDVLQVPLATVGVRLRRAREALKAVYHRLQLDHEH